LEKRFDMKIQQAVAELKEVVKDALVQAASPVSRPMQVTTGGSSNATATPLEEPPGPPMSAWQMR
jgi:hypothetical protein